MLFWTVILLVIAQTALPTFAIPVDSYHSVRSSSTNLTTTDFVHSWGPSIVLDWVDRFAYPNTNYTTQQLCQKIGSQLEPLADNFWKDFGGSMKTIAGATPWIAEAAVKYSRGEQS
ncbi:hypothetical protein B0H13DRAFT_2031691 [Mycena leptocephala]|nr:hypothetical protein B0H13DRAFT_2031691 [Mycena leptocephala]